MAGPTESDFERLRERLESSLSAISGTVASFQEEQRKFAESDAEAEEKRAKAARSGELGADWQKVQQRIDLKTTTLADVFTGKDESPEARALLGAARAKIAEVSQEFDREAEDSEEETPIEEVQRMQAEFQARMAELQRRITEEQL
ncbi:hypothetical protein BH11ACT5_BH11ACT5_23580 [soil metagenome]